ncbi:hypothetical protein [Rhizobium binxianense]|uniref:hypothetical protein n=1 Tax=Rhizobium binxianense TaxID=3024242 RepID=UPI00236066AA|nr:hypothetical protein [Rhizobium sp. MJ37]MDC9836827.1 hypothetical protein [Rhizobium sp. MJ37]
MEAGVFLLTSNAFNVVGATYHSTAAEISDLVEETGFSASVSEAELHKAQQTLLTPRLRLAAELSWLPELSDAQISTVMSAQGKFAERALPEFVGKLPELAKANILADFCARQSVSEEIVSALLEAWERIEPDTVLAFLRSTRRAAGMPDPDAKLLNTCLHDLKGRHAIIVVASVLGGKDPGSVMRTLVDDEVVKSSPSSLLPAMVKEYEKRNERNLSNAASDISDTILKAKTGSLELSATLIRIVGLLQEWSKFARPIGGFYRWRGHSEPRTKALFFEIRGFLLDLVNNEHKLDEAKKLILWAGAFLAETDDLKKVSDKDLADIEAIMANHKAAELFEPLAAACETAKSAHKEFSKVVRKSGVVTSAPSPVGPFVSALEGYLAKGGDADLAAVASRDLSLSFNNDFDDPEVAYKLLQAAMHRLKNCGVSQATTDRLGDDAETLFGNWKIPEIEKQKGNLSRMMTLVEESILIAPPGLKMEFSTLHSTLTKQRRDSRMKLVGWGVIIAIIAVPIILSNAKKTSSYSSSTGSNAYRPSTTSANKSFTPDYSTTSNNSAYVAPPTPVDSRSEVKPSSGLGQALSRSELRYCIFQGKRLDLLRNLAFTDAAVSSFNALVSDFNQRCGNFRYKQNDMDQVKSEAASKTSQFMTEASTIAKGW